jgi:hypothetical protein
MGLQKKCSEDKMWRYKNIYLGMWLEKQSERGRMLYWKEERQAWTKDPELALSSQDNGGNTRHPLSASTTSLLHTGRFSRSLLTVLHCRWEEQIPLDVKEHLPENSASHPTRDDKLHNNRCDKFGSHRRNLNKEFPAIVRCVTMTTHYAVLLS